MPYALRALVRNLVAGARLALFLPVERLHFRVDPLQLLLLVAVSALVDVGADALRAAPPSELAWSAVGSELAATALVVLVGAVLAWWTRDREVLLALPIVVLAAFVPLQFANTALDLVPATRFPGGSFGASIAHAALTGWVLAVLVRTAYVVQSATARRLARAFAGGAMLALPLFLPYGVLPASSWWREAVEASEGTINPASEPALALQRELQDEALSGLEDHASGTVDLYFIAFAPDGAGAVWSDRVATARQVMEGQWSASGRTLTYVNDARTLSEAPIATVTHLREALAEVAGASDPDEDVVMLYLAGRSNPDGSLRISLPPLDLVQLSGPGLRSLLDEAGIRWRIVVLSVCTPGPFIEALADENTVVIANAPVGEQAADCARNGEPVAFADAFFGDAMRRANSLNAAFEAARAGLGEARATNGGKPVMHVGRAIADRLDAVKGRSGGILVRAHTSAGR